MSIDKLRAEWQRKYDAYATAKHSLHVAALALDLAERVQELSEGDVLKFVFGRGAQRKELTGTVLGTENTDKGWRIRVFVGRGVHADIKTIRPRDVTAVITDRAGRGDEAEK